MKAPSFWLFVVLVLIAACVGYFLGRVPYSEEEITSFEECVAAGYPVMESYPEQCMTPEGKSFTREVDSVPSNPDQPVFCTLDAKICPDGTAVGRTGPNCEFAPCPGE
jgi:hypothetical protein